MVAQLPAPIPSSTIYPSPFSRFPTPSAPPGNENGLVSTSTSIVTTSDEPARPTLRVSRRKRQVADRADIVLPSSSIGGKNGSKGVNGTLGDVNGKEGEGVYLWLGKEGPSIFIGTMQICSKSHPNESISCTSASQGTFHSALLPLTLGETLVALPTAPPAPILLLVGGTASLLALLIYLFSLFAATSFGQKICHRSTRAQLFKRHPQLEGHIKSDTDHRRSIDSFSSLTTLVNPIPLPLAHQAIGEHGDSCKKRNGQAGPAFLVLAILALGLSVGANVTELIIVQRAKKRWDEEEASRVGLKLKLGILPYLLPCIPLLILCAIAIAYIPVVHAWTVKRRPKGNYEYRDEANEKGTVERITVRSISPPKQIEPVTQVPEEWTRVSLDRSTDQTQGVNGSKQNTHLSVPYASKRDSARRSWRSMIGMAV